MPRGRPRKPTSTLARRGTLRSDRRGGAEPKGTGEPKATHKLAGEALATWKREVPPLVAAGLATALDSMALTNFCEQYAGYLAVRKLIAAEKNPGERYKLECAALGLWKSVEKMISKFGMTPGDRQRLDVSPPEQQNPFEALSKK